MPNYRRATIAGGTFFFTVVTQGRAPFLTSDLARSCLRSAWIQVERQRPFVTDALCLLPDHLHCIWSLPDGDSDYSKRWAAIKGRFSHAFLSKGGLETWKSMSRRKKGEVGVWQRRFWEHSIRNEEDLRRHFDYIHYNPVKHGYSPSPEEWKWSTFQRYLMRGYYGKGWGSQEPDGLSDMWEACE